MRWREAVPEGPHLYPDDDLTDLPDRLLAAEIVREQIFLQTHEEVPYGDDGGDRELAGAQGRLGAHRGDGVCRARRPQGDPDRRARQRIKAIGARARAELAGLLERKVHLFLNVKQRAGWDEEAARLRAIGLEDPG